MMPTDSPYIGTLGMPRAWQRWFDALRDAGVTNLADQSVGEKRGMFLPSPTSQIALNALRNQQQRTTGTGSYYQPYEDRMKTRGY